MSCSIFYASVSHKALSERAKHSEPHLLRTHVIASLAALRRLLIAVSPSTRAMTGTFKYEQR